MIMLKSLVVHATPAISLITIVLTAAASKKW